MKKINSMMLAVLLLMSSELLHARSIDPIIGTRPVDPCTLVTHRSTLLEETVLIPGYGNSPGMDIYIEKSVKIGLPGRTPVVLIINGNGYGKERYTEMARFLARNGFVVGVAEREATTSIDALFPLNALYSMFALHDIEESSPIALVGHSKGGFVVNEAALENVSLDLDLDIRSIINVAPNIEHQPVGQANFLSGELNGHHTRSFLSVWGSSDQDVQGEGGTPREGIAAYDRVGTESTTTCGSPPCFIHPHNLIEKISVYVHGANHAEFMGTSTNVGSQTGPFESYLSQADQTCIGKAYINAFLRKHLYGEATFDRFLRNEKWPPSLLNMTTYLDDGLGSPAGSHLRIGHQYSPVQKRVIENFEDQNYQILAKSSQVLDFIINENAHTNAPFRVRHLTDSLFVAWETMNSLQYIGFDVPSVADDASTFTHLSVRLGLFNGMTFPMYANGEEDVEIRIGLIDQNYHAAFEYRRLNRPDTHTTMQTISIPLDAFNGIDLRNIQMIYVAFERNTQGSLIMDSIEWTRQ